MLLGLVWHGLIYFLAVNTFALGVLRLLLDCALAIGWALLFVDAWRLGQPLERAEAALAMVGLNGVLCFSVAGGLLFASHMVAVQRGFIATMFGDGVVSDAARPLQRAAARRRLRRGPLGPAPGRISVVSIDQETGKAIIFGLPRLLDELPVPRGLGDGRAVPRRQVPGLECGLQQPRDVRPGQQGPVQGRGQPGVAATTQGVEGITGLKINYYAMVNLQGFRSLVQAVGGLEDQRPRPDWRGRRPGDRLHRAGRAAAQRLRDAVVRTVARERGATTPRMARQVRDERHAPAGSPRAR